MSNEIPQDRPQTAETSAPVKSPEDTGSKARRQETIASIALWVDITNKSLQILALLIAGLWTWTIWQRTSAPGLESKLNVQSGVQWSATSNKDRCRASFSVNVKNEGQRSVEVEDLAIIAWVIDLKNFVAPSAGRPTYVEPDFITKNGVEVYPPCPSEQPNCPSDRPGGSAEPIQNDLKGHYPPGSGHNSSAQFLFNKSPDTLVVFSVDVSGHESNGLLPFTQGQKIQTFAWAMEQVCDVTPTPRTTTSK